MDKIQIQSLSRFKNKEWIKDIKADILVGGFQRYFDSKKYKCHYCKKEIFFLDNPKDNDDLIAKEFIRICPNCVLDKHPKCLNKEQKKLMSLMREKNGLDKA